VAEQFTHCILTCKLLNHTGILTEAQSRMPKKPTLWTRLWTKILPRSSTPKCSALRCSSINSSTSCSSSSMSPDRRAALAMKYGGSSPMAVPAPYQPTRAVNRHPHSSPDLSLYLFQQQLTIWRHCCHIGTAIKHPVPDQIKLSFVIFDIQALWRSGLWPDQHLLKCVKNILETIAFTQPQNASWKQHVTKKA